MEREISFGNWIKRRRKALDLTQQDLASRIGCSISLIFKIESDERRPSRQITQLLAEHLDIPLDQRALFMKVARREKAVDTLEGLLSPYTFQPVTGSQRSQYPLPQPLTSLIGRENEARAVIQQLADPTCRLLTLVGPGGIGKTRLALEVAHRIQDTFEHGVFFVSLAGTDAAEFIIPVIAESLGFGFSGTNELKAQLFNHLRDKQILLVLDNLEHLLNGIELLGELLTSAPWVKLLITSREPLHLRAEWVFEVQGLPVPASMELKDLEANSAAALFIRRARQVKPNFTLTWEDAQAIAHICRVVEGSPLGLELAAPWARIMSTREIAQEIERNVDFLTTTARDVPPRHRSMRAVFDYSWNLLSEEEQRILRQLAVFSGGFTRQAAEQVAGADLSQLSALADKSLLRHTAGHSGRYDFHELIRQYVELKARQNADEHTRLHERHANYYAAWLQSLQSQLEGPQQQETLRRISLDIDNVRSAWNRMIRDQQTSNLQQSLTSVFILHDIRNWLHQGAALFEQAVTAWLPFEEIDDEVDENKILLGELMVCQGHMIWHLGQAPQARELLQRSLDLLAPHRNRPMLAEAFLYLSLLEHSQGNYSAARSFAEECVSLNQELARDSGIGYALSNLGMVCLSEGRYESAYTCLKESVAVMRSLAHPRGIATNLARLGLAAVRLDRLNEAQEYLAEALETTRVLDDRWGTGNALNFLGWLALKKGDLEAAESLMRESTKLFEDDGEQLLLAQALSDLGFILYEKNPASEARGLFLHALQIALHSQHTPAALYALAGIATIDAEMGAAERAVQLATYSRGHPASNFETKSRAENLCIELETRLTPQQLDSARARAESTTMNSVALELLRA